MSLLLLFGGTSGTTTDVTITDTLGASDNGSIEFISDDDRVVVLDSIVVEVTASTLSRTFTDQLGLDDTSELQATDIDLDVVDPLGAVDSGSSTLISDDDRVGLVDSISSSVTSGTAYTRTVTDPLGLLDAVAFDFGRTISDPLGGLDAIAFTFGRTQTDPLGLLDAVVYDFARIITDPVGLVDAVSSELAAVLSVTDVEQLVDALVAALAMDYTVRETGQVAVLL